MCGKQNDNTDAGAHHRTGNSAQKNQRENVTQSRQGILKPGESPKKNPSHQRRQCIACSKADCGCVGNGAEKLIRNAPAVMAGQMRYPQSKIAARAIPDAGQTGDTLPLVKGVLRPSLPAAK